MNDISQLEYLLRSESIVSYRQAVEMVEELGRDALPVLRDVYFSCCDSLIRSRIVKLAGSIEDSCVVPFLRSALRDDDFSVRRAAALSLKILIDEDHFPSIYRSRVGRILQDRRGEESSGVEEVIIAGNDPMRVLDSLACFMRELSSSWTYRLEGGARYFTFRRNSPPDMKDDGKVLYKNLNYSLERILLSGRRYSEILDLIFEAFDETGYEDSEKEDVLRQLRQRMGSAIRDLEEGLSVFLAVFHYLRFEMSLQVGVNQVIPRPFQRVVPDLRETMLQEKLMESFRLYPEFSGLSAGESFNREQVSLEIMLVRVRFREFEDLLENFSRMCEVSPRSYRLLVYMGQCAVSLLSMIFQLLSEWGFRG